MNARVRMLADARSLFWPWCITAAAGILSMLGFPHFAGLYPENLAGFGLCIGVPLLATLAFGNEFQFGTLSSLLSQPIERSRVWKEKTVVIVAAVLSASIAYAFSAHFMGWKTRDITVVALWVMITVGSSAYWTLVTRSTIGGLVLHALQSMALALAFGPLLNKIDVNLYTVRGSGLGILLAIVAFATAYTVLMLYLGRRRLLRFQVTGAAPGSNVLATDWLLAPSSLGRLLRCTASGGTWNLVRKELHLLWPLAPLTLIAVGGLLAFVPLRFVSGYQGWVVSAGVSIILIHGLFAAILGGTLSLGEERSLGLHNWNLTQPVSVRRQWTIKLMTALFASTVCSAAVILAARLLLRLAFFQEFAPLFYSSRDMYIPALFPLLIFIPFWCASGVNGTVRAAFWCLPVAAAVVFAYDFGLSFGMSRAAVEVVRALTEAIHPFPFTDEMYAAAWSLTWQKSNDAGLIPSLWVNLWLVVPAAIQSYRLFRSEISASVKPLIRQAVFLALFGFSCGFLQPVPAAMTGTMFGNTLRALAETSREVGAMQIDPTAIASEAGYTLDLNKLPNSVALSDKTRAWFSSDTLVLRPVPQVDPRLAQLRTELKDSRYIIIAELHGGWKCAFVDNLSDRAIRGQPLLFQCKSKQGTLGWWMGNLKF